MILATIRMNVRSDKQKDFLETLRILALMDLLSKQPDFQFNTVSHTSVMEFIKDVLNTDRSK